SHFYRVLGLHLRLTLRARKARPIHASLLLRSASSPRGSVSTTLLHRVPLVPTTCSAPRRRLPLPTVSKVPLTRARSSTPLRRWASLWRSTSIRRVRRGRLCSCSKSL